MTTEHLRPLSRRRETGTAGAMARRAASDGDGRVAPRRDRAVRCRDSRPRASSARVGFDRPASGYGLDGRPISRTGRGPTQAVAGPGPGMFAGGSAHHATRKRTPVLRSSSRVSSPRWTVGASTTSGRQSLAMRTTRRSSPTALAAPRPGQKSFDSGGRFQAASQDVDARGLYGSRAHGRQRRGEIFGKSVTTGRTKDEPTHRTNDSTQPVPTTGPNRGSPYMSEHVAANAVGTPIASRSQISEQSSTIDRYLWT